MYVCCSKHIHTHHHKGFETTSTLLEIPLLLPTFSPLKFGNGIPGGGLQGVWKFSGSTQYLSLTTCILF